MLVLASCRDAPVGHRLEAPLASWPPLPSCVEAEGPPRVRCPVESLALLDNPHLGFTSFSNFASDLSAARHPRARVAYQRFWWNELEPAPGAIDFASIDRALAQAAADGQTFAFRVMPEELGAPTRRVPAWLVASTGGTARGSPDYDSSAYLEAVERTAGSLGARYDGNPLLDHVDVGFVGDAGEWAQVAEGSTLPNEASAQRLIDAVRHAFPRTPVLMSIGAVGDGARPLAYAVSHGAGWRADCWGDLRGGWNHHDAFYEQQLDLAQATEAWRSAPVAVETCGEMELWHTLGYDLDQVRWALRWALDHHVSVINNKSRQVPSAWRALVDEYLTHAGYRFTVWRVQHETKGPTLTVQVALANRGTAPLYQPARLAVRVRGVGQVAASDEPVSLVPPGGFERTVTLTLPPGATGELELAVVDDAGNPMLHLANEGERDDGWLPVSTL
jgi:Domain of unknown function (DUF4832)/Beta-galactosidase